MISTAVSSTEQPSEEEDDVQRFWVYKRGQLVLTLSSKPGPFIPTRGPPDDEDDDDGVMAPCEYASGQFMSVEWEPRIRRLFRRSEDLVDLIEFLEDRRYEVDLEPPSKKVRHFRFL